MTTKRKKRSIVNKIKINNPFIEEFSVLWPNRFGGFNV